MDGTHGRRIWRYRQKYRTIDGLRENTINAALRRMGYSTKENITGHGFRATACTILDERLGFDFCTAVDKLFQQGFLTLQLDNAAFFGTHLQISIPKVKRYPFR